MASEIRPWFCFFCGWEAPVETWQGTIGPRWVCRRCGWFGNLTDHDAPRRLPDDAQGPGEPTTAFEARLIREDIGRAV